MEYQKIINLLVNISDQVPRFVTKNWVETYDQSGGTCNTNKEIRFKTPILRSDLCDFNDAYIIVTGKSTVTNPNNNAYDKKISLKDNAPFFSCILKINNTLIENAEDLHVVIPLYNLLKYNKSYRKQQDFCLIIIEMSQIVGIIITTEIEYIIQLKILSLLIIKQVLQVN